MATLDRDGFEIVPNAVDSSLCESLIDALPIIESSGARTLLKIDLFAETAGLLRNSSRINELTKGLVPIQCTYFRKSQEHNWSLQLHRDTVIPLHGHGPWKSAGTKEGLDCVQPPREFLDQCIAVRLNLDAAIEGDLRLVRCSHLTSDSYELSDTISPPIPAGAALVFCPSTVHGSAKLKLIRFRRVLHFLFIPALLPKGYQPYTS